MLASTKTRWGTAILTIAPVVMLVGFAYHPNIGNPFDDDFLARLAAAVVGGPTRWVLAHMAVAVGSGLMALAFVVIRTRLREAGDELWSVIGLPFVVMGSTLYALLPAMEFAPLAASRTGADVAAVQGALLTWFAPTLFTGALVFGIGAVAFAVGIASTRIVSPALTRIAVAAIVVMAVCRFVPLSAVQFHVQAVAGVVGLWGLAYGGRRGIA